MKLYSTTRAVKSVLSCLSTMQNTVNDPEAFPSDLMYDTLILEDCELGHLLGGGTPLKENYISAMLIRNLQSTTVKFPKYNWGRGPIS